MYVARSTLCVGPPGKPCGTDCDKQPNRDHRAGNRHGYPGPLGRAYSSGPRVRNLVHRCHRLAQLVDARYRHADPPAGRTRPARPPATVPPPASTRVSSTRAVGAGRKRVITGTAATVNICRVSPICAPQATLRRYRALGLPGRSRSARRGSPPGIGPIRPSSAALVASGVASAATSGAGSVPTITILLAIHRHPQAFR